MLEASLILNVVLLVYIGYINYPALSKLWMNPAEQHQIALVESLANKPVCPTCKKELIGKIYKSASGHMCCHTCLVTVYGNK